MLSFPKFGKRMVSLAFNTLDASAILNSIASDEGLVFSCHGIAHSRNTDKVEKAQTVVMVGFGPMSGANCAYIHTYMCASKKYYYHA